MMTHRAKIESRLHAAQINGGAAAATLRAADLYTVTGRAGDRYSVKVFGLEEMRCDCKAGQYGNPCWHAAAAFLRIVADRTEIQA
jgi:uncharacterized Zn finger protein